MNQNKDGVIIYSHGDASVTIGDRTSVAHGVDGMSGKKTGCF
jgi:hypothetical protein